MKFLIDAQLPPALVARIAAKGHQAWHVDDIDLRHASDREVLGWAFAEGCILITKDRDFAPTPLNAPPVIQIVWVRIGNCSNRLLFERFDACWADIEAFLEEGHAVVEMR